MSIGYRIFIVEEEAIFPISQKTFNELYSGKVGALTKFANQTVQIAVVIYTVHQRKPKTIIQIDCERIRIMEDGSLDEIYVHEGRHVSNHCGRGSLCASWCYPCCKFIPILNN